MKISTEAYDVILNPVKMTTIQDFFTTRIAMPAMSAAATAFFYRPDIALLTEKPDVDYNRVSSLLKDYIMSADVYREPKQLFDSLVSRCLDQRTKFTDDNGKQLTVSRSYRDKLSKLCQTIERKEAELTKTIKASPVDDVIVRNIVDFLMTMRAEEAKVVDEVIRDGSSFVYRRRLDDIEVNLLAIDFDCRQVMRARKRERERKMTSDNDLSTAFLTDYLRSLQSSPTASVGSGQTVPCSPTSAGSAEGLDVSSLLPMSPPLTGQPVSPSLTASLPRSTSIRVAFLRQHRPTWFASDIDYRNDDVFFGAFGQPPDYIDSRLLFVIAQLKNTKPTLFDEVCALLAVAYEEPKRPTRASRTAGFLEVDSSDDDDDDFCQQQAIHRRRAEIIVDCIHQLMS